MKKTMILPALLAITMGSSAWAERQKAHDQVESNGLSWITQNYWSLDDHNNQSPRRAATLCENFYSTDENKPEDKFRIPTKAELLEIVSTNKLSVKGESGNGAWTSTEELNMDGKHRYVRCDLTGTGCQLSSGSRWSQVDLVCVQELKAQPAGGVASKSTKASDKKSSLSIVEKEAVSDTQKEGSPSARSNLQLTQKGPSDAEITAKNEKEKAAATQTQKQEARAKDEQAKAKQDEDRRKASEDKRKAELEEENRPRVCTNSSSTSWDGSTEEAARAKFKNLPAVGTTGTNALGEPYRIVSNNISCQPDTRITNSIYCTAKVVSEVTHRGRCGSNSPSKGFSQ